MCPRVQVSGVWGERELKPTKFCFPQGNRFRNKRFLPNLLGEKDPSHLTFHIYFWYELMRMRYLNILNRKKYGTVKKQQHKNLCSAFNDLTCWLFSSFHISNSFCMLSMSSWTKQNRQIEIQIFLHTVKDIACYHVLHVITSYTSLHVLLDKNKRVKNQDFFFLLTL